MEFASKISNDATFNSAGVQLLIFTYLLTLPVRNGTIFMTGIILKIMILYFIFCSGPQYVFGTNILLDSTRAIPIDYFEFKDKFYNVPFTDLQVTVPIGWKGINLSTSILISQHGIDIKTGEARKHLPVLMVIGYVPLDSAFKTYGVKTLAEYVQRMAKTTNCAIHNKGPVLVNGFDGFKIRLSCKTNQGEKDNIINYFFTSNSKVIYMGLKGINPYFNRNIENFEQSVNSIANYSGAN